MNDDELVDRLRRTLHREAAAITPGPDGHPAPEYQSPARLRLLRRGWPVALVAAAAAAGVALAVINWPGGGSSRIGVVSPGPSVPTATTRPAPSASTAVPTVAPPSSAGVPATIPAVVPIPATTVPTATTVAPTATGVSRSFQPEAVTFVSSQDGWVAGRVPCGSGWCLAMGRSTDGGQSWTATPAPQATVSTTALGGRALSVRFADALDGWIYTTSPTRLWSTHDGGVSWRPVQTPALGAGSTISAMEASGGYVWVAALLPTTGTIHLQRSPVNEDAWSDIDTGVRIGAGPVPSTQLVLHGTYGWLIENDRTVVGGARLVAGRWSAWSPPCATANGTASLAASSATDLVAVCEEGQWGPASNLPANAAVPSEWVFTSSDGGASFRAAGPIPSGPAVTGVASPAPATIVVDSLPTGGAAANGLLSASFDAGHTWQTVFQVPSVTGWTYVGFTTLTQGVAIDSTGSGSTLSMTRDGGHTWAAALP